METRPWWSRPSESGEELDGRPDLRWPWLRADPIDEQPSLRVNPDDSEDQSRLDAFNPMSFAYQPFGQVASEGIDVGTQPQVGAAQTPLNPSQQSAGVDGLAATSVAVPTAPVLAGSEAARAALTEAAALAARIVPAAARAASGPAAALSVLVTPGNSQGETIDLGDGLQARLRPGQRSVEIERQAGNGLFRTGIGARWETLPVNAEVHVGENGAPNVLIDHQQLQAAVGLEATARAVDAIGSKMARPPKKGEDDSRSQANTAKRPDETPNPDNGRRPPGWSGVVASTAELAAKILEQANRPQSEAEAQAEIAQACRSVMRARGQETPYKQYREKDGYETAVGVRMPQALPDPTPGRDFSPQDPNHRKGYIAELELANLVYAQGNQFVVHYGNAPGVQGPDVLSIGPDGRFTAWDSKARSAERSVGPSMAASTALDRAKLEQYVWREIDKGRLPPDLGLRALKEFNSGNYNVCTVGTGNAHNGYIDIVRQEIPSGPRRQ